MSYHPIVGFLLLLVLLSVSQRSKGLYRTLSILKENRMKTVRNFAKRMAPILVVGMFATAAAQAKTPAATAPPSDAPSEKAVERLGVPGPIAFNDETYVLAWSSHPEAGLYKQEYLQAGEPADRFSSMVMIDLRSDGPAAIQMAQGIATQIAARKDADPVANYDTIVNPETKEVIIDFLLSAKDADGVQIVEWSAHRYTTQPDGTGTVLVGNTRRGYGEAAIDFLKSLKAVRQRDIEALSALKLDVVEPTQSLR